MHKYHAQPTMQDGVLFASKAEAKRYAQLLLMVKARLIRDLRVHPRYTLHAHVTVKDSWYTEPVGEYVGDFEYVTNKGEVVTEDVKGVRTALYRWKKKHFQAQYRRIIYEINA